MENFSFPLYIEKLYLRARKKMEINLYIKRYFVAQKNKISI